MRIEDIQAYDMILDDSFLVTSITYTYTRIMIDGIPARGRSREQILRDEGWWYDEN